MYGRGPIWVAPTARRTVVRYLRDLLADRAIPPLVGTPRRVCEPTFRVLAVAFTDVSIGQRSVNFYGDVLFVVRHRHVAERTPWTVESFADLSSAPFRAGAFDMD
jgi:hypothetical protein